MRIVFVALVVWLVLGLTTKQGWYVFGPFLAVVILLIGWCLVKGIRQLRRGS